jgi:hypothetical protein
MKENYGGLKCKALTQEIIGVFYEVYNELGHGFIESVYEAAFELALTSKGLSVFRRLRYQSGFVAKRLGTLRLTCLWTNPSYWNSKPDAHLILLMKRIS